MQNVDFQAAHSGPAAVAHGDLWREGLAVLALSAAFFLLSDAFLPEQDGEQMKDRTRDFWCLDDQ